MSETETKTWEELTPEQKQNWATSTMLNFGVGDLELTKQYFETFNKLRGKFSTMTPEELIAYEKAEEERYNNFVSWDNLKEIQKKFWTSVAIEARGIGIDLEETKAFYIKFNRNNLKYNIIPPEELVKYEQDFIKANSPRLKIVAGRFPLCAVENCPNKATTRVEEGNKKFSLCDPHTEQSNYKFVEKINPV